MGEVFRRSSVIVQRYGGTVDKFTGDGIMAVFGAPIALEDHAVRACRSALDIQTDAQHLAAEVEARDRISLQLRIGLNSGEVITGEIGSGPMSYTAVGEQVGMAQRMESVAPPGGVMVSDSTARLVDTTALLGDTEQVHIKGAADPVPAHRLLGMAIGRRRDRVEPTFVGRQWEMGALAGVLQRSVNGNGSIVGLVGPPGIGKSRVVRELTAQAKDAGAEIFATFCESHTTDLPLHTVADLLLDVAGAAGLDAAAARARVRERFSDADEEDIVLLDDVLGIGDPDVAVPQIDPDARRRRLAAMVNASALNRPSPAVYVIEDAHWIDSDKRVLACRLSHCRPADQHARRGYLPAGIHWRLGACAAVTNPGVGAAGRLSDVGAQCRSPRRRLVSGRTRRSRRRAGCGQSLLRRGDRPGSERARRAGGRPRLLPVRWCARKRPRASHTAGSDRRPHRPSRTRPPSAP